MAKLVQTLDVCLKFKYSLIGYDEILFCLKFYNGHYVSAILVAVCGKSPPPPKASSEH